MINSYVYGRTSIKNRNHIAHNKLVDFNASVVIHKNIEDITDSINKAYKQFGEKELSVEEQKIIDELNEIAAAEFSAYKENFIESEAGVSIRDTDEIFELFKEEVDYLITGLYDEYYFRDDIKIRINEVDDENDIILLSINSELHSSRLKILFDWSIDDSQGGDSYMELYLDINSERKTECKLEYKNGAASYNAEQGYYMPEVEDGLMKDGLEQFESQVNEVIEECYPDYEYIFSDQEIGEGIIDEPCENCGEHSVSNNEDLYPIGKCFKCGMIHEMCNCIRCERTIFGKERLCQNCGEWADSQ